MLELDLCTLLGPEGSGNRTSDKGPELAHNKFVLRPRYRPYFEDYIVDASIFDLAL